MFTVEAIDAKGWHIPIPQNQITSSFEGWDIIGLGNCNPNDMSIEKGVTRAQFNDFAQVIVKTHEG